MIRLNTSKGLKASTTSKAKSQTQKKSQDCERVRIANEVKRRKALYLQKRAKEREQVEERSATNIEYLEALDVKECMLEIQSITLGKLAAQENHCKRLAEIPGLATVNLTERIKEAEETLSMLKY